MSVVFQMGLQDAGEFLIVLQSEDSQVSGGFRLWDERGHVAVMRGRPERESSLGAGEGHAVQAVVPFVSFALYDHDGALVRSLLYAEPVEKSEKTIQLNHTTDMGKLAVPGEFTARGVFFTEPPRAEYVMMPSCMGSRTRRGR